MKVSNQKPVVLSPVYSSNITGGFAPDKYLKNIMAKPLFEPLVAGQPVTISNKGNTVDEDEITNYILGCCGDVINQQAEDLSKDLYSKTLVYFDKKMPLSIQNAFLIQAATKEKLPAPTPTVVYTPATDIIPISKEFLAGKCNYEKYFATLGFYARPRTLGFYFANDKAFDAFKTWLNNQIATISATLPADTNKLFQDFQSTVSLTELTESLVLRNVDTENNGDGSFARVLISYMMLYTKQISNAEFGVLPFDVGELFCPKTIVFVNIENHTQATAKQIADEWAIINNSINAKIKMMSNKQIAKLTAPARNLKKIQNQAADAISNSMQSKVRTAIRKFKNVSPDTIDITKMIARVMKKMVNVNKSDNSYKSVKMSFARPNRRDPDDFNKQGKVVSTKYKPDLHIYLDTSGSISEKNYQDSIRALIKMAKALNINLYFNSFSHVLSQCTHLHTKDKSSNQVYAEFQKIPKVGGGTDYEIIWNYINMSKKRQRELSLVITDMDCYAPNHYVKHPKNIYYIPCSKMDWNLIKSAAMSFCKSMQNIDPNVRQHLLF